MKKQSPFSRYKRRSEMLLSKRNMGATERWRADMKARQHLMVDLREIVLETESQESAIRSRFLT